MAVTGNDSERRKRHVSVRRKEGKTVTSQLNHIRKKRWQVYSVVAAGNPLLVDSFDLRQDEQRLVDRMEEENERQRMSSGWISATYILRDGWEAGRP